ncbi:L,D-transpeptidase [Synechococcus sp. MU1642]
MLELVASFVVDLPDQRLTVYNSDQAVVRVIPISTGKASTPTPIFDSKV